MKPLPALRVDLLSLFLLFLGIASPLGKPTLRGSGQVVAWGDNASGQIEVPGGLTNVVAIAGGATHSLALRDDGTVVGWGDDAYGKASRTAGLSGIVAISAGVWHSIGLRSSGEVVVWGQAEFGQAAIPPGLVDVVAIAAGGHHNLALISSGRVVAWGYNASGEINVPAHLNLASVVAIAAGYNHSLALKSDGTVISWGSMNQASVPVGLTDVAAIAAGWNHNLAMKVDGTVVSWGSMTQDTVPPGLSNVVLITAGSSYSLAVKADGELIGWGSQSTLPANVTNVWAVAGGSGHRLALVGDRSPSIIRSPISSRVYEGTTVLLRVAVVGSQPLFYQWRMSAVELATRTNSILTIGHARAADEGDYDVVVSNSFGVATSRVARISVVAVGTPEVRADAELLTGDVTRGDRSAISISTVFPNGVVFYTTDGSDPDFASAHYQAPFTITQTTMLRAIAYSADFAQSAEDGPFQVEIVPTFGLTRTVTGQGVIIAYPDSMRHLPQTSVGLAAYPAPGWKFLRWEADACGTSSGASMLMDMDKTVIAVFEPIPRFVLGTSTAGGGTIIGNAGSPYFEASVVNVVAQPAAGWQFMEWQGDATGNSPNLALTMDRPKSIQAVFGTSMVSVFGGQGSLALHPTEGPYAYGSTVRITARPNIGNYFATWGGAASFRANPLDFVVTNANPTISALFAPLQGSDVNVFVDSNGQGTVAVSPNLPWYSPGATVSLAATPAPGWRFVRWQGEASGTSPDTTVVLNVSKTVMPVFEALPRYTFSATTLGGGTISDNPNDSYPQGAVVNLTAHPAPGWQFLYWKGNASGTTANLAVTIERDTLVQAVFGTFLSTNVVGPGTVGIDPGQGPYPYGSTVRFTATPNVGASFVLWGNAASGSENPLDYVVTSANPAFCALFTPGENTAGPSITMQPLSQPVVLRGTVLLRVSASGASPFTYQWRKDGSPIAGATASSYLVSAASANDGGIFDVVVSNPYGSVTSTGATVTVVFPPSIAVQPASLAVKSGTAAALSVTAAGTEPLSYQWHSSAGPIAGATSSTFTLDPALTNHSDSYAVVVSNPYGTATSQPATLTVFVPVGITSQPVQQVVPLRGTATFAAQANGYPVPQYQWLFNGQVLSGANGNNLVITNVGTNALGDYSLMTWNAYSAATSSVAKLLMSPSLRSPFLGATVIWGKSATLLASAVGSGELSYQWFKDGVAIPFASGPTLIIPTVQLGDAGLYSLVVRSAFGSVTNTPAQLVVNPANVSLAMYAGVTLEGVAGYTYGIQYTTNLTDTNSWVNATNLTLEFPLQTWIDLESATNARRFYRVIAR